jgi:hypothetical protein
MPKHQSREKDMAANVSPISFDYDRAADVLYVTFGTGEPSFSEEIDGFLVMDVGMYSGAPTGFQVLHVKEIGVKKVNVVLKRELEKFKTYEEQTRELLASGRDTLMRNALKAFGEKAPKLVAGRTRRADLAAAEAGVKSAQRVFAKVLAKVDPKATGR